MVIPSLHGNPTWYFYPFFRIRAFHYTPSIRNNDSKLPNPNPGPNSARVMEQVAFEATGLQDISRWTGISPLFDTAVFVENYPEFDEEDSSHPFQIDQIGLEDQTDFPLSLSVHLDEDLRLCLDFDASVLDEEEAQTILQQVDSWHMSNPDPNHVALDMRPLATSPIRTQRKIREHRKLGLIGHAREHKRCYGSCLCHTRA